MEIEELKQLRRSLDKLRDEINEIEDKNEKWKQEISEVEGTITMIIAIKNRKNGI